ncbi:YqeG family HAD IIIA-type phosphatase [Fictibacillus nanhaiensis]|uniref:YqeG family HAD IIIA-type phosphatase n=1 Tax=Fictibacillus nanhaiensis TaxID=742169 RepID=UPI002E1AAFA8|nr:YqeG family HAD IIIA-type phosphatase [Fictibacillus nanhaiensis]MED1863165.1 YqeG family HAD IIIA-type phosphatase [Fictibacillus nanhaiensis]
MLKHFLPDQHVQNILDITPEMLVERGVKGIITDLDNTLVEWDRPEATPELIKWFTSIKEKGILITIVSNNTQHRVKSFSDPVGIPFIYSARKPMTKAFKRALKDMKLKNEQVVVIGDQLLTDVLGGNRIGLHTILVVPVASSDGFWTRFNRKIERIILSWMKRKGMLHWEE